MKFNKKVFALALAGTMVCTSIVVPASSDSKNALKLKSANLLLESRGATRGQAVMMVLGALGYKEEANQDPNYIAMNPFTDVSTNTRVISAWQAISDLWRQANQRPLSPTSRLEEDSFLQCF